MRLSVCFAVVCGLPLHAAAQIAVDVDEHVPFSAAQLDAALRLRVRDAAFPVQVDATDTGVRITVNGRSRDVPLGARTGDDAARLVALAAADLMLPALSMPLPVVHLERVPDEAAAEPAPRGVWSIGLTASSAMWNGVVAGGSASIVGPVHGVLVAAELGMGTLVGGDLHATTGLVRLGVGTRVDVLELRAGLTVVPLRVSDGSADATVLVGAGASANLRIPVTRGVHAVVLVGGDAFATRTEYLRAGMMPTSTPMIAPYFAAGVEVTP